MGLKRIKRAIKFFSPGAYATSVINDKLIKAIADNLGYNDRSRIDVKGIKGLKYRGLEMYYVAYQVGKGDSIEAKRAKYRIQYLKLMEAHGALNAIENKYRDTAHGSLTLSNITGANAMSPERLKRQAREQLVNYNNTNQNPTWYALFTIKTEEEFEKEFQDLRSRYPYNVYGHTDTQLKSHVQRYNVHFVQISRADMREMLKAVWKNSPNAKKNLDRLKKRTPVTNNKRTPYGYTNMSGGVHTTYGEFIRLHQEKIRTILNTTKLPLTKERHIGVELEAAVPKSRWEDLRLILGKSKYAHYMCLGTDGSVFSDEHYKGGELRLCAPTDKIAEVVNVACSALQKVKAIVDKTCGLHVHLDARNMKESQANTMFANLVKQQRPLYLTQPASRRGNTYCKWSKAEHFYESGDRYHTINPTSYRKYNTIEVRLHSGTMIAHKINNWIKLLEMIAYGPELPTAHTTVKTLLQGLQAAGHELSDEFIVYFLDRAAKFDKAPKPITSAHPEDYRDYQRQLERDSHHETEEEWPLEDFESEGDDDADARAS